MLVPILKLTVGAFTVCLYGYGLYFWIYRGRLWPALAGILGLYPLLLAVTISTPWMFLRAAPLLGVGMFLHRYRGQFLSQIRLLWFTTLSVLSVQGYYLAMGVF